MVIGIDATLLRPDRTTGVERYALGLLRGLAALLAPDEVVMFVRPDAPPHVLSLPFRRRVAPLRARVPVDQVWLPLAARAAGVDLLHTLAFPTPVLWRGPAAMTVHDATPWLFPEVVSKGMRLYYRPLFPQALARAAAVFTVSRASRRDLATVAHVAAERIHVTPNGVDARFLGVSPPPAPPRPYLLAVGTLEPRKNLGVLVEAFRLLRRAGRELQLVIAGRTGWGGAPQLAELAPHVRLAGYVEDGRLPSLYAGAACFVQPSRYEGFGLALAEAMAAGVPTVVSEIAAHREVAGHTARYAPPDDPAAFAAQIAGALDDRLGTARRVSAARVRVRRFTWDACAARTATVYRTLLGRSPDASRRPPFPVGARAREIDAASPR
jgi:glycosyltransferase involved in cell wall biosynthesis